MKAIVLHGADQAPRLTDIDPPEPRRGQVRIRLAAAALNHRDVYICQGKYPGLHYPATLGADGVGVVDAHGPGVDGPPLGQRVVIDPGLGWGDDPRVQEPTFHILGMPTDGTFADYVVVPAENVYPAPGHLTDHQAAALPLAHVTAWRAVVTRGAVRPDERVLVTGIGGGVALAALQLATAHGADVWVTSSSASKIEHAERLGARGGALYTDDDWGKALQKAAGGPFDLVIDGAGGDGVGTLVRLLGPAGRYVFYGGTVGKWPRILPQHLFFRQISILGSTMGSPADFEALIAFAETHGIVPVVDRVYALADAPDALARMDAGGQFGKIVLAI